MKAMIFAAGLGTRLMDETRFVPKALVDVAGKPLLQRALEKLTEEGIDEIVINVHHFSESVIPWIKNHTMGMNIHISDESTMLLDTGGGLKKASVFLRGNEPVILYNVDILCNLSIRDVIDNHLKSGSLVTLVVRKRITNRYFLFNRGMQLMGWANKKTGELLVTRPELSEKPEEYAFSGIHVINPEIFKLMPPDIRFPITPWYLELSKNHNIHGYVDKSDFWLDVGKTEALAKARKLLGS